MGIEYELRAPGAGAFTTQAPAAISRTLLSSNQEGNRRTALVVGAGFGGIAAALRLKASGFDVTLFDRLEEPGGRAQVFERDGFRHDAGPTVITAPFLFDELFQLFGRQRTDYVQFAPLRPWYRFHFHDGSRFDYGDLDETLAEIERVSPPDVEGYKSLLEHSKKLYDLAFTELAHRPFDRLGLMLRQTPRLARLRADLSVWQAVARRIKNENLRRAFSIQPLLIGGDPHSTTSIYALIHYLERRWGVFFAMGGTGALVRALRKLLVEAGVNLRLGTTVQRVLVENGRAAGVELESGERVPGDIVVSNADPCHLYRNMIEPRWLNATVKLKLRSRLSMGLFLLYFGTRRRYEKVAHNSILLGESYRGLLDDVFRRQVVSDDISLYVHRPTATDASFAPAGCDSFYALCPVPNEESGIDWQREAPRLRERIIGVLEQRLLPGLRATMTADFVMTPADFESRYLSCEGNGFSIAPYFMQSAWFRFHNRSECVRGLYLVGAGTHPGAGLPGVLSSAKVIETMVAEDLAAAPARASRD